MATSAQTALANFLGPKVTNGNYGTFNVRRPLATIDSRCPTATSRRFLNPGAMALVNGTLPLPTRHADGNRRLQL